jgi:predicted metal-dependent hydrolase
MEIQAEKVLLPFAREVADGLGLKPAGFEVGRGMRKLGHCTAKRVIQLSRNLMFLPEPLVRYIICHELAHLTHMNHSPEFHALCDQYCNGQEKALERQLRQFSFPILK